MKLSSRFEDALIYATRLHASQVRKGSGVPYVTHLLGTVSNALDYGADEDQAIAALLHEVVEDQGGAPCLEEIRERFGERVARIVAGCTDAWSIPKPPWQERKEAHLSSLREADEDVLLVCCADKLHNARSLLRNYLQVGDVLWKRFRGGKEGTLWYYRSMVDLLKEIYPHPIVDELECVVLEIEKLVSGGNRA
ncbi:MAG: HD domain-containing protein [Anaerolineaceae bacterium]|nr:HD domain-containing protein [Anaerolineaceae bacterium]